MDKNICSEGSCSSDNIKYSCGVSIQHLLAKYFLRLFGMSIQSSSLEN